MIHFLFRSDILSYSSFLKNTFLFNKVDQEAIDRLLDSAECEEKSYLRGEVIYSPEDFERKIGFVCKGECLVVRRSNGNNVPLNTVKEADSFGIVTVFSSRERFPTLIIAKTACTVLFFSADTLKQLIGANAQISLNVIEFLTEKIDFLNDKVAAFSGGSIEEKLISYLLGLKNKHNSLEFEFNKKKSAEALNCGRASLYRAIDTLESGGYISVDSKKIYIKDLIGLERILK